MNILITGSTGLLGQALSHRLAPSANVTGLSRHPRPAAVQVGAIRAGEDMPAAAHVVCDLLDLELTRRVVQGLAPQVVVHAQAMSNVDRCETEPELARAMNVDTTRHMVQALAGTGALLVYVSTDYVFDGAKQSPYDETDAPNPLSVYGRSKVDGEAAALGYQPSLVVRPSTLFGPARRNFCNDLVQRLSSGQPVEAFVDQSTSPTYTEDLADGIAWLIEAARSHAAWPSRIVHVANAGGCTRLEFARRVSGWIGAPPGLVRPIRMAQQRRPAPRPAYSVLTTQYGTSVIGRILRPWDTALQAYLQQRHWIN